MGSEMCIRDRSTSMAALSMELDARTISVDLDCVKVRNDGGHGRPWARSVLVVASGAEKAEALGVALRGGLCTDLVVDASVAELALG